MDFNVDVLKKSDRQTSITESGRAKMHVLFVEELFKLVMGRII